MPKEGFVYVCPTARASNARDSLDIDDRSPVIGCDRSAYPYQEYSLTLADNFTLNKYDYLEYDKDVMKKREGERGGD